MNNMVWHYDKLNMFVDRYGKDVLEEFHLFGDEIDIGYTVFNKLTKESAGED